MCCSVCRVGSPVGIFCVMAALTGGACEACGHMALTWAPRPVNWVPL